MSTAAQIAANTVNAQSSTGPVTEAGQATSSKNAITHGLFTAKDFIRPREQADYDELGESLRGDLAPVGTLEHNLVDEIRRAIWRLDRCGKVEGAMILPDDAGAIPDPMQDESQARLQLSVDRARSQAHRLLHKCTAELRKLQTERRLRDESFEAGADISQFGLCDWAFIRKALDAQFIADFRRGKLQGMAEIEALLSTPLARQPMWVRFVNPHRPPIRPRATPPAPAAPAKNTSVAAAKTRWPCSTQPEVFSYPCASVFICGHSYSVMLDVTHNERSTQRP